MCVTLPARLPACYCLLLPACCVHTRGMQRLPWQAPPPPQGKPCSGNCNGVGTCNHDIGVCMCSAGWGGHACTTPEKRPCTNQFRYGPAPPAQPGRPRPHRRRQHRPLSKRVSVDLEAGFLPWGEWTTILFYVIVTLTLTLTLIIICRFRGMLLGVSGLLLL